MASTGHLQADPLFQGLTRPAMIFGVSYLYFVINSVISMVVFINSGNFFYIFVTFPVVHMIGYFICLREPRAIELLSIRTGQCWKLPPISPLRRYYGYTNSYDVY